MALADVAMTWFCGERVRSKDDFNMKMYKDEVEVGATDRGRNSGSSRTTKNSVGLPKMMTAVVRWTATNVLNIFQMLCLSCYFA